MKFSNLCEKQFCEILFFQKTQIVHLKNKLGT